eukprot:7432913-Alexandrium_andersonii.AAC.1
MAPKVRSPASKRPRGDEEDRCPWRLLESPEEHPDSSREHPESSGQLRRARPGSGEPGLVPESPGKFREPRRALERSDEQSS